MLVTCFIFLFLSLFSLLFFFSLSLISYHLDSLAEEIEIELQEAGQLSMVALTKKYNFPIDFLTEVREGQEGQEEGRRKGRGLGVRSQLTHVL